ncbi:Cell cycle serine/threonine-protein kinase cdc5/MSD2 [Rhizophlyctis rosea]|nr:Cell cycle serine/threonine-protein kinase cdc5/MSD2 [Rhizophlyctis rosea]
MADTIPDWNLQQAAVILRRSSSYLQLELLINTQKGCGLAAGGGTPLEPQVQFGFSTAHDLNRNAGFNREGTDQSGVESLVEAAAAHKSCPSPPPVLYDRRAHSQYQRGRLLGEGSFPKYYEVTTPTTDRLAAKVVPKASLKSTEQKNKVRDDITASTMVQKHVIMFFRNIHRHAQKGAARLTELEVRYYMWQRLNALRYMHGRNIIHRDVKFGNLFLDKDMNMKVGDF